MTSRTGHGHAPPHAQGSWVRDYESVDYDVPLLDPQARADSDDEMEGEETERCECFFADVFILFYSVFDGGVALFGGLITPIFEPSLALDNHC